MAPLHVFFLPFMASGHSLPALDMAKLFSSRGVKVTVISTEFHAPMFNEATERSRNSGFHISIREIKFPAAEVGLPDAPECFDPFKSVDTSVKFFKALAMLQEPVEQLLRECSPHCLVADMFFPWATNAAAKFGIPRLLFNGSSTFALCAQDSVRRNKPYKNVSSDSQPFLVPDLPHQIKLTSGQLSPHEKEEITETNNSQVIDQMMDSEGKCYGVIVNSFYDLEPDYADHYRKFLGRRAWYIGPFYLCNKMGERGKESAIDSHECLKWLDLKKPKSVLYVCFGSGVTCTAAQLNEIASGLEASGKQFIWVVRKCADEEDSERWFPGGFEERMKGRGLIIKGWAPQVLILEHEAVGAFVTHCGWNSLLEGACAGVPMVTWPFSADQFFNEKLVTDVLKIGVPVGSQQWSMVMSDFIKKEAIINAIHRVMEGKEALEIVGRAKALKEMASKALEEGGSSYNDLTALLEELSAYHSTKEHKSKHTSL